MTEIFCLVPRERAPTGMSRLEPNSKTEASRATRSLTRSSSSLVEATNSKYSLGVRDS